jgi:hypothetical protein
MVRAMLGVAGRGGDDVEAGDVGDVSLAEGPARLGQRDEPIGAVLACEQATEHPFRTTSGRRSERPRVDWTRVTVPASMMVSSASPATSCAGWESRGRTSAESWPGRPLAERSGERRIVGGELGVDHGPADQHHGRSDRARPRSASDTDEGDPASGAVAGAGSRAVAGADGLGLRCGLCTTLSQGDPGGTGRLPNANRCRASASMATAGSGFRALTWAADRCVDGTPPSFDRRPTVGRWSHGRG